jgi:hypothetical protein
VLLKTTEWICEDCDNYEEEVKEVLEPTDRAMVTKRLMAIPEDYEVLGYTLTSEADAVSIRIRFPDFDMSEMRAIKDKQRETGFITADELLRLQKAGYNRPREVPPKPQPKERSVLRERARQRAFQG